MTLRTDAFGLPWETAPADRRRLRGWLRICGTLAFCLGLVMPWLPLPERPRPPAPAVTAAPVEISLEQPRRIPLPPPPLPPAPKQTAPSSPPPVAPARSETAPKAAPAPAPTAADARAAAASAGLLAASSALEGLRGAVDTRKLASRGNQASGVGTAASVDRALLTSRHGTRSAGLNEGSLSRATGGVELAGRATTRVGVPGGTGGDGGVAGGSGTQAGGSGTGSGTGGSGTGTGQRSIEEIRRVFDANKGAIFALYHRALRADPGLRGQVVLELVIEPGGTVTEIRVVSSELPDPELLDRLMGRVRMFDFGAREVGRTRISYPVHFLPG